MPCAEHKYKCDAVIGIVATCITMGCISGYFIYLIYYR